MLRQACAAAVIAAGAVASTVAQPDLTHSQINPGPEGTVHIDGLVFDAWSDYVASPSFEKHGTFCGTPAPPDNIDLRDASDCSLSRTNPLPHYGPVGGRLRIPIVVHVIQSTTGEGFLSEAQVHSQIDILNEDFQALPGTPGENGVNAEIEFYLVTEDPGGSPHSGITYHTNDEWFDDDGDYWDFIAWDTTRFVNVYTNTAGFATGYVPGFPQQIGLVGQAFDRIVVQYDAFGRNGTDERRDQGRALTHEFGHYFGLLHIFQGCYTEENCNTAGDLVCDTPPANGTNWECVSGDHCGTPDDFTNYMDYTPDVCMEHFTSDQVRRMRCTLQEYRPTIYETVTGCAEDSACDDGDPCNGVEFCVNGICNAGPIIDCNQNGIDDACDIGSGADPDCNENGVPDSCDINKEFVESNSGRLAPVGFGYEQTHTMEWALRADTDVDLRFDTKGDFDAQNEFVDVYVENTYVGRVYESGALCFSFGDVETITVPMAVWNSIVPESGGPIEIGMVPSADVSEFDCWGSFISLEVSYFPLSYSDDDNGDGIPDECQDICISPADLTTQGTGTGEAGFGTSDGAVTGADLFYYVNSWLYRDFSVADVTTFGAGIGDPGYGVPDGLITGDDINYYVNDWIAGCP